MHMSHLVVTLATAWSCSASSPTTRPRSITDSSSALPNIFGPLSTGESTTGVRVLAVLCLQPRSSHCHLLPTTRLPSRRLPGPSNSWDTLTQLTPTIIELDDPPRDMALPTPGASSCGNPKLKQVLPHALRLRLNFLPQFQQPNQLSTYATSLATWASLNGSLPSCLRTTPLPSR